MVRFWTQNIGNNSQCASGACSKPGCEFQEAMTKACVQNETALPPLALYVSHLLGLGFQIRKPESRTEWIWQHLELAHCVDHINAQHATTLYLIQNNPG